MGKRKLLGIPITVVLVFGMMLVGCDSGSSGRDTSFLDTLNLSRVNPSSAALSVGGLNQEQFNEIVEIAGGGFQGWATFEYDGDEELIMAWTSRSRPDVDRVAAVLSYHFDDDDAEQFTYRGIFHIEGDGYRLDFFPSRHSSGGFYVPAGTLMIFFWRP